MANDHTLVDSLVHASACLGSLLASAASVVGAMALWRLHRQMPHLPQAAQVTLGGTVASLDTFRYLSLAAVVLALPPAMRPPKVLGGVALAIALVAAFAVWVAL